MLPILLELPFQKKVQCAATELLMENAPHLHPQPFFSLGPMSLLMGEPFKIELN